MHSMVRAVEKDGDWDHNTLELQHADMDQGFWNDTYSYGGWDWGRPVPGIVFCACFDTCVCADF